VHDGRAYPLFRPHTHRAVRKVETTATRDVWNTKMKVQISNYTIPNSMGSQGI